MTSIEKETQKYISDVSSKLLCSSKKKKELVEDIRRAVLDFVENSGIKDISDVCKHFGTPEELAKAYMSELDPKQIKKKVNIRRAVTIALVVTIAILVIGLTIELIDAHRTGMGYFSEKILTNKNSSEYIVTDKSIGDF